MAEQNKRPVGRPKIDPSERTINVSFRLKQWKLDELLPLYGGRISDMMNSAVDKLLEYHKKIDQKNIDVEEIKNLLGKALQKIDDKNK